jgi:hypothetical protein
MQFRLFKKSTRKLVAGIVLAALVLRALIPTGFMPSGESPFSLVICHDGLPAHVLLHHEHHHSGRSSSFDHCPFGGLASAPTPHFATTVPVTGDDTYATPLFESTPANIRLVYIPQPRGPPFPA